MLPCCQLKERLFLPLSSEVRGVSGANLNSPGEESRGRAETSSWLGTSTVAGAIVIHSGACLPGLLGDRV